VFLVYVYNKDAGLVLLSTKKHEYFELALNRKNLRNTC